MDNAYLSRLSENIRAFVNETEAMTGIEVAVVADSSRNGLGFKGEGSLKCTIEATSITIHAPTTGYFPEGAVVHEILHARRLHIDKVPRLEEPEDYPWTPEFSEAILSTIRMTE